MADLTVRENGGSGVTVGRGALIADVISERNEELGFSIGLDRLPECGRNDEVLAAHGLNADKLAERFKSALESR